MGALRIYTEAWSLAPRLARQEAVSWDMAQDAIHRVIIVARRADYFPSCAALLLCARRDVRRRRRREAVEESWADHEEQIRLLPAKEPEESASVEFVRRFVESLGGEERAMAEELMTGASLRDVARARGTNHHAVQARLRELLEVFARGLDFSLPNFGPRVFKPIEGTRDDERDSERKEA